MWEKQCLTPLGPILIRGLDFNEQLYYLRSQVGILAQLSSSGEWKGICSIFLELLASAGFMGKGGGRNDHLELSGHWCGTEGYMAP